MDDLSIRDASRPLRWVFFAIFAGPPVPFSARCVCDASTSCTSGTPQPVECGLLLGYGCNLGSGLGRLEGKAVCTRLGDRGKPYIFSYFFPSGYLSIAINLASRGAHCSSEQLKIGQVPPPEWSQCGVSPPETQLKGLPGKVTQGKLIYRVQPEYPAAARKAHIQGTVVLCAKIGKDGTLRNLRAASGPEELIPSAMGAVAQWRYKSYRLNKEPV